MLQASTQASKRPLKRTGARGMPKSEREVEVVEQGAGLGQFLFLG
jgi:hypothetical protein